jgi:SAM-dependent methyltransferase
MPSRDYHESIWESLPAGLAPEHAAVRERLLLEGIARVSGRAGAPPRVLDVGCGEGRFAALLARTGARVVGVDVAPEPLRRARNAHPRLQLELMGGEASLPFEDCSFDAVWAGEVIEHVADTQGWLSELRRVLRSGGALLLSTPNHGRLQVLLMGLCARRFDARFDPRGEHLRFYTRRTLAALLADLGFEEVSVRGAGGLPGLRPLLFASALRARF